jgi:phage tail-like protein
MRGESQFFSIGRKADWERGTGFNMESGLAGYGVKRDTKYGIADTLQLDELAGVAAVKELAVSEHEHLYLLDERADLWIYDRRNSDHKRLFTQGHNLFSPHARIAASGELLFVGDSHSERSVAAYHTGNGQTLWSRIGEQADGIPFHPLAVAADDHYLYVLTPLAPDTSGDETVVPAGSALGVIRFTFGGSVAGIWSDPSFTQHTRAKLRHLNRTYYMTAAADGGVCIFDTLYARLFGFGSGGEIRFRMMFPALPYAGICADSAGRLYIGDSRQLDLGSEDDRFIIQLNASGEMTGTITSFRGKTDQLLIDRKDRLYTLNGDEGLITILNLQPRTLLMEETGVPEGMWLSTAFDSAEAETVWHKLTLQSFVPDGTQLHVSYFSLNEDSCIINGSYRKVDEWIKDDTVSYRDKLQGLAPLWSEPIINPQDALFFGAKGRYLWLKLDWIASERYTPLLESLRVYFPRETYLSYLPAVYQEDADSRDFLERFLSLFGTLFTEIEDEIGDLSAYIDPERATGEHLRWLATWVGLETDDYWTDEHVKAFIKAAPELYRYRGTRHGLMKAIEIYTGAKPLIVEYHQTKAMRDHAELRPLIDQLYGGDPYTFTVLLQPEQVQAEKQRVVIEQLLEEQKPAYTEAKLVQLQPWMYLDLHTYLGVNTLLTEPSLLSLNPNRAMPNDTLIVDMGMEKRLDVHTRLEMDSELE